MNADLSLGLATAPALFALQEYPQLKDLINRRFENEGDVQSAREYIVKSNGIERTKELASAYCEDARKSIERFATGDARDALLDLTHNVLVRTK